MGYQPPAGSSLEIIDADDATAVAAAAQDVYTLQPPAGTIYQVISFYWNIPAIGGSAGNHHINIERTPAATWRHFRATNAGTSAINCNYDDVQTSSSKTPSNAREQANLHNKLWASNSVPLYFEYDNQTDTQQAGTRTLRILVRKTLETC